MMNQTGPNLKNDQKDIFEYVWCVGRLASQKIPRYIVEFTNPATMFDQQFACAEQAIQNMWSYPLVNVCVWKIPMLNGKTHKKKWR